MNVSADSIGDDHNSANNTAYRYLGVNINASSYNQEELNVRTTSPGSLYYTFRKGFISKKVTGDEGAILTYGSETLVSQRLLEVRLHEIPEKTESKIHGMCDQTNTIRTALTANLP